jgi:hypothetical protein
MRSSQRKLPQSEADESYYISMTDLMVGVIFIFIIMLSYFALQFRTTTQNLLSAKDAQTTALLQVADNLVKETVEMKIDREKRIVCLPSERLNGPEDQSLRCFAYSQDSKLPEDNKDTKKLISEAAQVNFITRLSDKLLAQDVPINTDSSFTRILFDADKLFLAETKTLSPEGQSAVAKLAHGLAETLPCHAYGLEPKNCLSQTKMSGVMIITSANFNAFTLEGRAAQALSLERSVTFHQALLAAEPSLGALVTSEGSKEPLIRLATYGQSVITAPEAGSNKTLSLEFNWPT